MDRLRQVVIPETVRVGAWIAFSAAITAVASWVLQQPDLVKYYGLANIVLYFLNELKKKE